MKKQKPKVKVKKNKAAQEMVKLRNKKYGKKWLSENGKKAMAVRYGAKEDLSGI